MLIGILKKKDGIFEDRGSIDVNSHGVLALDKIMTIATPLAPVAVGLVVEEVRSTKRRPHHD